MATIGRIELRTGAAPEPVAVERPSRTVRAVRTPTEPSAIRNALGRAYAKMTGTRAPAPLLDVLTAHVEHETARGDRMFNFNFGGIKGASPEGLTATYRTREVFDGVEHKMDQGFRAYSSIDKGALDYLTLMRGRYANALEPAARGDAHGFAQALASRGYFTAPVDEYASAVGGLLHEGVNRPRAAHAAEPPVTLAQLLAPAPGAPSHLAAAAPLESHALAAFSGSTMLDARALSAFGGPTFTDNLPDSANVTAMLDALSASSIARIASPTIDEDE